MNFDMLMKNLELKKCFLRFVNFKKIFIKFDVQFLLRTICQFENLKFIAYNLLFQYEKKIKRFKKKLNIFCFVLESEFDGEFSRCN